jgi:gluconolactonase
MNNSKHWFDNLQSAICNSQWKLSRRRFLTTTAGGIAGVMLPSLSHAAGVADRYPGLKSSEYLGQAMIETEIEDKEIFTEGPAVDRAGNVYFTNVPVEKILKWDPKRKKLSVFREHSNKTNGLLFDPDGNLLCCEGGAGRVTRTEMKTGKITVLADTFNGFPFASPNDIALDQKGHIYFTSRPGTEDPSKGNVNAVYRIDKDGSVDQILAWPKVHMPNGIVTSPNDKTLYVIEAHPDADRNRNIMAYDLDSRGKVSNPRVHINLYPGRSGDGMCIDAEGNLYVAAGLHKRRDTSETLDTKPGIHVISPKGKLVAYVETPVDTITNCAFGGKDLRTLYVACDKYLLSIRTQIPGKPDYRPNA